MDIASKYNHPSWAARRAGCRCEACVLLKKEADLRYMAKRRIARAGRPRKKRKDINTKDKFFAKLKLNSLNGCLEYTGTLDRKGYGEFSYEGKIRFAHRLAYYFENGDFDQTMLVCHSCDNPKCCNPVHLFLGTHEDNMRDMVAKGRSTKGRPPSKLSYEPRRKLTDLQVADIRANVKKRGDQTIMARIYNVSNRTISGIVRNERTY